MTLSPILSKYTTKSCTEKARESQAFSNKKEKRQVIF